MEIKEYIKLELHALKWNTIFSLLLNCLANDASTTNFEKTFFFSAIWNILVCKWNHINVFLTAIFVCLLICINVNT